MQSFQLAFIIAAFFWSLGGKWNSFPCTSILLQWFSLHSLSSRMFPLSFYSSMLWVLIFPHLALFSFHLPPPFIHHLTSSTILTLTLNTIDERKELFVHKLICTTCHTGVRRGKRLLCEVGGGEGVDKNQSHHKSVDQRTDPWDWQKILFSWLTVNKCLYANPHQAPVTDQAWYQRGKVNLTVPSSSLGILIGGVEHRAKSSSRIQDVTHPVYPLAQSPTLI